MSSKLSKEAVDIVMESADRIDRMIPILTRKLPSSSWHSMSIVAQSLRDIAKNARSRPSWSLPLLPLDVVIPRDETRGMKVRPHDAVVHKVCLRGKICGSFVDNVGFLDPFSEMNLLFFVSGETSDECPCSWAFHFDRHLAPRLGNGSSPGGVPHPLYHVQFGGHELQETLDSSLLILDVPRIVYPPMDYGMAVDYLLSSFAPLTWRSVRQDPAYGANMRKGYIDYWRPFYQALIQGLQKRPEPTVLSLLEQLMPLAAFS